MTAPLVAGPLDPDGDSVSVDVLDGRRSVGAPPYLGGWQDAGLLAAADVHVARRLADLHGSAEELTVLGAAFAVRAVRLGHVCVDLTTIAATAAGGDGDADLSCLPWPDPATWTAAVAASALTAVGDDDPTLRPLRLVGSLLYLDRYWRQETLVAADLAARAVRAVEDVDLAVLSSGLDRLFPPAAPSGEIDFARAAAAVAVGSRLAVIAGGPGTGKTTTVARVLALLDEQAAALDQPPPRVALAAPTGKAAARLAEAVHEAAVRLDVEPATRDRLLALPSSTLHRLLGWRPDSHSRFRHDRSNRLSHDVVVVDETSMLSLSLMSKLVDAVRPGARLVLIGDPEQLASVEAGAVLGDVVGPALRTPRRTPAGADRLARLDPRSAVAPVGAAPPADGHAAVPAPIADSIVVLRRVHRFGGGIAELASAVSAGDGDAVMAVLGAGLADVTWTTGGDASVRSGIVAAGTELLAAGQAGDGEQALAALSSLRVLCALRQGPAGVAAWNDRIESWLASEVPGFSPAVPWYPGRPLLVTSNDYQLQLFNGDTGVVVDGPAGRPVAVFERKGRLWAVAPSRLAEVETVHAMTVHKSQGSQFARVVVVLPETAAAALTRELLYTAVTRARQHVTVLGSEAVIRAAVARPVGRASGLGVRLWRG